MSHTTSSPLSTAKPRAPLCGRVTVPGDKSISHRALMLGAIATGRTRISGLLEGEDVLNTAGALRAMGCPVRKVDGVWEVLGRGVGGLDQPDGDVDFGNSGTGVRLMMGLIAGNPIAVRLTGDASLSKRPMGRVLEPLQQMGLEVQAGRQTLPLGLRGSADLIPIVYRLPVASAQVKSAVLLAGLHAAGSTSVIEGQATRDHTERMLRHFGAEVSVGPAEGGRRITVTGDAELEGRAVQVPGDPSSAAFLVAAALVVPGSEITISSVLVNPTRTGFYLTLREMGADCVVGVYLCAHWAQQPAPRNLFEVIGQCFLIAEAKMCDLWKKDADFLIEPDIDGFAFDCFDRAKELIASGEEATRAALPGLRKLLNLPEMPVDSETAALSAPSLSSPSPQPSPAV